MTGLFGSKRQQAADIAELGWLLDAPIDVNGLLDRPVEPITQETDRKLRSLANKAAWRAKVARVKPDDEDDDG